MAPLICIMGPTASGKTALAVDMARVLDGELISVDSALVYRGLDIGSAKPDFPHHLIDICDPTEAYSAARFASDAARIIAEVEARGRRPILVGGTMLYYRALLQGLDPLPAADPNLRRALTARGESEGWPALHAELVKVDPVSATRIHPNHSQRLVRALEVHTLTGRPLSAQQVSDGRVQRPHLAIALAPQDRHVLHARIEQRFAQMLNDGFLDEVKQLYSRSDLHRDLPAMRAVGYRQLWEFLDGECDFEEAVRRGVVATRQLAKRQFTWLRKWPQLRWILTDESGAPSQSNLAQSYPTQSDANPLAFASGAEKSSVPTSPELIDVENTIVSDLLLKYLQTVAI